MRIETGNTQRQFYFNLALLCTPNIRVILQSKNPISPKSLGGLTMEIGSVPVSAFQEKRPRPLLPHLTFLIKYVIYFFSERFYHHLITPFVASSSALDRSFLFSSSIFLTLPKEFLLHSVSFSPHACTFPATSGIIAPIMDGPQALVIVSLQPLSWSHTCSNLKVCFGLGLIPSGFTIMA